MHTQPLLAKDPVRHCADERDAAASDLGRLVISSVDDPHLSESFGIRNRADQPKKIRWLRVDSYKLMSIRKWNTRNLLDN